MGCICVKSVRRLEITRCIFDLCSRCIFLRPEECLKVSDVERQEMVVGTFCGSFGEGTWFCFNTYTHILSHHTCIFRSFVHLFTRSGKKLHPRLAQGSTTRSSISRRRCRSSRCRTSPSSRDRTRSTGSHIRSF